jgi:hypothetical protein
VVKSSSMTPPPRSGHRCLYLAATLLGLPLPPSTTSMTMTTLTLATSASKGYHLHVVLAGFYSSHSIRAITMLQLWGDVSSSDSTFNLFSSVTVCGAPAVTAGGVRVYLVGYIFCIIDCHICRDIFGRIDIMYYRLPYVSRGALPLKTLVLYIYRPRGTMQYNQQLYAIYSSYNAQHQGIDFEEVYASVARLEAVWLLLTLAAGKSII